MALNPVDCTGAARNERFWRPEPQAASSEPRIAWKIPRIWRSEGWPQGEFGRVQWVRSGVSLRVPPESSALGGFSPQAPISPVRNSRRSAHDMDTIPFKA